MVTRLASRLSEPLPIEDIEFRVQSINKGGYATILAYKDARVDIKRLNEVVGVLGWKREHSRENHNCTVSLWDENTEQWVSKEDTGTESNTEAEKGLASDSFKRACFNWGIGIELYDYPRIQIKLNDNEWNQDKERPKASWGLNLRDWKWKSGFSGNTLVYLHAVDGFGKTRFIHYGETKEMVEAGKQLGICFDNDDYPGAAEIYDEWSQGELAVICRAESNGGQLVAEQRAKLKSKEFRLALNEARGIEVES